MKIYTVSELTEALQDLLETNYSAVWVMGEISNFKAHHSGHFYFRLKDHHAVIEAVMFRGHNAALTFRPEEGLAVLAAGSLTYYRPQGRCQLVVRTLEPQGLGALQLAFEQLKKKLELEGLFALEAKRPLPFLPKRIGVITSRSGAALRDIIQVATRRYPNIEIVIDPVAVQGVGAAGEISAAIARMNERDDIDLLIVGRGGGSIEDLWAFNEEEVARAIFASRLPIISAVGHETDFTIADFVADARASTPSAAAELAVPVKADLAETVGDWRRRLQQAIEGVLVEKRERLQDLQKRLKDPRRRLEELMQRTDELSQRITRAIGERLQFFHREVARFRSHLTHLSPLAILGRGYCIARLEGSERPLTAAREASPGQRLDVQLARGGLLTEVLARRNRNF